MAGQLIGYVRVSSEEQNTDRQVDKLSSYNIDRIFTDRFSGKSTDRPALQEMMRFIRDGDHLYVHSMDRLARNLLDLRNMVNDLTVRGVKVSFVKENLTFTGDDEPVSVLLLSVMGAVAEFERSIIRERQAEGIRIAKAKGTYKGRVTALKQEQMDDLKRMVLDGVPKTKIARKLKISRETVYKYLKVNC